MSDDETREEQPKTKPDVKQAKVKLTPEQIASRQRAHDMKVAKMLAGGEF